ncbi:MAG: hypothetical protein NNA18_09660 [Nitrospira sp.]|nr:hypothetical protein [Nitrospira sp.]
MLGGGPNGLPAVIPLLPDELVTDQIPKRLGPVGGAAHPDTAVEGLNSYRSSESTRRFDCEQNTYHPAGKVKETMKASIEAG